MTLKVRIMIISFFSAIILAFGFIILDILFFHNFQKLLVRPIEIESVGYFVSVRGLSFCGNNLPCYYNFKSETEHNDQYFQILADTLQPVKINGQLKTVSEQKECEQCQATSCPKGFPADCSEATRTFLIINKIEELQKNCSIFSPTVCNFSCQTDSDCIYRLGCDCFNKDDYCSLHSEAQVEDNTCGCINNQCQQLKKSPLLTIEGFIENGDRYKQVFCEFRIFANSGPWFGLPLCVENLNIKVKEGFYLRVTGRLQERFYHGCNDSSCAIPSQWVTIFLAEQVEQLN